MMSIRYGRNSAPVWLYPGPLFNSVCGVALVLLLGCSPGEETEVAVTSSPPETISGVNSQIMDPATSREVLRQCSRRTPSFVRDLWRPTGDEVRALEARLGPRLDSELTTIALMGKPRLHAADYYRQYVGLRRWSGRRTIYVNGFHRELLESWQRTHALRTDRKVDSIQWRVDVISVCDGGTLFFGVEYDPLTGEVGRILFNSRAS